MKKAAPRAFDLAFVIALALTLLCAAVMIQFPAVKRLGWPRDLFRVLLWIAALSVLFLDESSRRFVPPRIPVRTTPSARRSAASLLGKPRNEKTILLSLAVVAVFAAASFYDFGRFQGQGRFLHDHEFYHYYIGSKYFPELGYDGLYCATCRALIENDPSLRDKISVVKNPRLDRLEARDVCLQRSESVASLFSEARWLEFKKDIAFFQTKISPESWQPILVDHGFNATPFWTALASSLTAHIGLSDRTLFLLALLDLLLIAGMLLLVLYAFGLKISLLFAIFFFGNYFATFAFTGGAFLRELWLACLVGFVCLLRKGKMAAAGFLLAVSALDRVFPLLFALLPAVLFIRETLRRRSLRHGQTRLLASFAASVVLLGGWSATTTGGLSAWKGLYNDISVHERWFSINSISMRSLFIVNPATSLATHAAGWDESAWLRERETRDAATRTTLLVIRGLLLALLISLVAREEDPFASLALLSFAPFLLLYPSNYYCGFLGVPILCWRSSTRLAVAVMALQIPFWLLNVVFPSPVDAELRHWIVSLALVLAFGAVLALELRRNAAGRPVFRRAVVTLLAIGALSVGGAALTDVRAARIDRGWLDLDLTPRDVLDLQDASLNCQQMGDWGPGWSRNDHLVFLARGPNARATVKVRAQRTGPYQVKIVYSTSPVFGSVRLSVNGRTPFRPVDLFAPRVGILGVVYGDVPLVAGTNEFAFRVGGGNPASTGRHFAIDRILLMEAVTDSGAASDSSTTVESRRSALDKAVAWLLAHPADFFDGGWNGICSEVVTLSWLSSYPDLTGRHAMYRKEIRDRLGRLNARRGYRIQPSEYEMLTAATYAARRLRLDVPAFERMAGPVRQAAESASVERFPFRPLFLCEYLRRLYPSHQPACSVEQSLLYRERFDRKLVGTFNAGVDRNMAPRVSNDVFSLTREVDGLTDFGREPPPRSGMFEDKAYWGLLCEKGIRWGMETGDILTVARLVLSAQSLGVASLVPSFGPAAGFLVRQQEPDGSFGVADPYSPDPKRDGVLAAILAIGSSLRTGEPAPQTP